MIFIYLSYSSYHFYSTNYCNFIPQNLTKGQLHVTDVSNASRTMLMNIESLKWDPLLCRFFGIPQHILPEIRSSAEVYGKVATPTVLAGVPIAGVNS